ncbi:L-seryl-tRNA(Sec) selenium transferase [Corynebacterium endometrii]|uniref:L-seryl-tRNA(Sec) selenium transferase n=1 Tax=Corynebacterium endometrii TaxID=2488819 RepID=A0A4P7QEP5_9CORY|nr:L-seryl-tRNA(Sec) selenium transferase [Corynebacterium endometrii]QCB28152.1 L-seryl-tRNA(Sec) selenium transferase [Corynebacterium endometrii]
MNDPRRHIPRTDALLDLPAARASRLSDARIKSIIVAAQEAARRGEIAPGDVAARVESQLRGAAPYSLRPVLNATGVIIHTNLGRAPLPQASVDALVAAAGYTDVELELAAGVRSAHRGRGAIDALLAACPGAEDALVVNNGAAALLLACAALAEGGEVVISRGELIEIGAGFRLPELIESAHVTLKEIGATNRTHLWDYQRATTANTGAYLKVHPSNFRMEGFTSSVGVEELAGEARQRGVGLIVDLGSGLLTPDATLPDEPDLHAQLAAGADLVIASGDKLLGGPQAGILLGTRHAIARAKKHPLARALRIDKLRLNALEAAVNVGSNAVQDFLHIAPETLKARSQSVLEQLPKALPARLVAHAGRVGGGGAPEHPLDGWAIAAPEALAAPLRQGEPAVMPRTHKGQCIIDLRCVPESQDAAIVAAIAAAWERVN